MGRSGVEGPRFLTFFSTKPFLANEWQATLAGALRQIGFKVEMHGDHFSPGTSDADWLREVGRRRWVVLTRDTRIRHRELERYAVETAKVGMLVLTARGVQSLATMVETMQKSTARLRKVLTGLKRPYIVHIMAGGAGVKVTWPAEAKAGE